MGRRSAETDKLIFRRLHEDERKITAIGVEDRVPFTDRLLLTDYSNVGVLGFVDQNLRFTLPTSHPLNPSGLRLPLLAAPVGLW